MEVFETHFNANSMHSRTPSLLLLLSLTALSSFLIFFNTQAFQAPPNKHQLNALADSFYQEKNYDKSIEIAQQALIINRENQQFAEWVKALLILAKNHGRKKEIDKKVNSLSEAIQIAHKHLGHQDTLTAYLYIENADTYLRLNIDSSIHYYHKAKPIFVENKIWAKVAHCHLGLGNCQFQKENYPKMEMNLNSALLIANKHLPNTSPIYPTTYQLLGILYDVLGNIDKSIQTLQKSLRLYLQQTPIDTPKVAITYQSLALAYDYKEEHELSIQFNKQAINILKTLSDNTDEHISDGLNNIGLSYFNLSENRQAINYLKQSLSIHNKLDYTPSLDYIIIYINLGIAHWEFEEYDSSLYYLHKALQYQKTEKKELETTYRNIGKTHFHLGDYAKALDTLQLAQAIAVEKYGENYYRHALRYNDIGEVYAHLHQPHTALSHYQKALIVLQKAFTDTSIHANPPLTDIYSKNRLLETLKLKAQSLTALYHQAPSNQKYLQTAHATYHLATQLIDTIRQDYIGQGSKQVLARRAIAIYDGAIHTAITLHQQTGNAQYQEKAFYYAEKNKALLLLEAIKESEAKLFANLPDSLLQQEDSLKKNLTFYETKLLTEKQKEEPDSLKIATWSDKVFNLKRSYETLQTTLETNHSDYYQLKYNLSVADIPSLQNTLTHFPNTALVEYFIGDSNIFVFSITAQEYKTYTIDKPSNFESQLYTFRQLLYKDTLTADLSKAYALYISTAHQLYQTLLDKALVKAQDLQKLIIIPDGQLGYIPFEALVTQAPADPTRSSYKRKQTHYLIQDYECTYAYSTTLLLEALNKKRLNQASQFFGGFAPEFSDEHGTATQMDCADTQLQALAHSQPSVSNIQSLLGGDAYLGQKASKSQFFKKSDLYRILHLSTHACVNDEEPMMNRIFFTDSSLLTYELYNMQFNADLAVLSACNTGSGKLVRGEGIMSLSRAFTYAGCPSIITSLWTANDSITAFIMEQFYHHLHQGQAKDQALRNAKLALLQHPDLDNTIAHPFYWATFVHIGNPQPIGRTRNYWLYALVALFTIAITTAWWWRR